MNPGGFVVLFLLSFLLSCRQQTNSNVLPATLQPGDSLDCYNGVTVYYNGAMSNSSGRNLASDGYNLGLKWQCVEYVKRYYFETYGHKMPNSYGNAKDFFDRNVKDTKINYERNLLQFTNGSISKPKLNDILVLDGWMGNPYGHVGIISNVTDHSLEIVQQNVGKQSRSVFSLTQNKDHWYISSSRVLGWLRTAN